MSVVWITGGAKGVGRDMAVLLAQRGWKVALSDIDAAALEEAKAEVSEHGACAAAVGDVAVRDDVMRCLDAFEAELGPVDGLVNNAVHATRGTALDFDEAEFRRAIDVSVTGYFLCTQAVARRMVARGYGRIVNMSSGSGDFGIPGTIGYACAKGAVNSMTRVFAAELAKHGVTVNTLTLGPVDTETFRRIARDEAGIKARLDRLPVSRFGRSEDFIDMVAYLLSPASAWTTATVFRADGGGAGCTLGQTGS